MEAENCNWVQLQKYIQVTSLLIDQGPSHIEKTATSRLTGQLKTAAKDLLYQRLTALKLSTSPVLSEICRSVFCPTSPDAYKILTELIFALRRNPSALQSVLSVWPKESSSYNVAMVCFSSLFFEDFLSPFSQDWELLRTIGLSIDLGEHLLTDNIWESGCALAYFLRAYLQKREVAQFLRAVYERPVLEIIYNVKVKLAIVVEEVEGRLRTLRDTFEAGEGKVRASEPVPSPSRLTIDAFNSAHSTLNSASSEKTLVPDTVQEVLSDVASTLQTATALVLSSLLDSLNSAPYGVRWICKALYENGKKTGLDEGEVGGMIGMWLFPGWKKAVFGAVEAVPWKALSKVVKGNLRMVERTLRHVFSHTFFLTPDSLYTSYLHQFIQVPDPSDLSLISSEKGVRDLSRQSRISTLDVMNIRETIGPKEARQVAEFQFHASVFPLLSVPELLKILTSRPGLFPQGVVRLAQEIVACFLPNFSQSGEFDCYPFLLFFDHNSESVLTTCRKKSPFGLPSAPLVVKKVKRAILRLFQAIEMIPDLGQQPALPDLSSEIALKGYLYQSHKAAIEKAISAKTVAEFLTCNLPDLPEEYRAEDYKLLFNEVVAKVTRRKEKNRVWKGVNKVLILAGRTVESLRKELEEDNREADQRQLLRNVLKRQIVVNLRDF